MPFAFTAGSKDGGSTITVANQANGDSRLRRQRERPGALVLRHGEATGSVVFAGYGLVVPETQNFGYDSYAGLDVKDKIVVVLRYFPEDADQKTRAILARYADLRYKAQAARQRGAKGMLVVHRPTVAQRRRSRADEFRYRHRGLGPGRRQHPRHGRGSDLRRGRQETRGRAEGARQRQSARRRVRDPQHHRHGERQRRAPAADRQQRGRVPAGERMP